MTPQSGNSGTGNTAARPTADAVEVNAGNPWFAVQLKPNSETIAKRNLARQQVDIFAPFEEITLRRGQHLVLTRRALFPGYLFVSFDPETLPARCINSTLGVCRLVSFSGHTPKQVPRELIAGLMQRCDEAGKLLPPSCLKKGDAVSVNSGPLADLIGRVEQITHDRRVWVLLDILGKSTRVTLQSDDLRLAS